MKKAYLHPLTFTTRVLAAAADSGHKAFARTAERRVTRHHVIPLVTVPSPFVRSLVAKQPEPHSSLSGYPESVSTLTLSIAFWLVLLDTTLSFIIG